MELRRTAEHFIRGSNPLTPYLIIRTHRLHSLQSQRNTVRSLCNSASRQADPPPTRRFNLAESQASSQTPSRTPPRASDRLLSGRELNENLNLDFLSPRRKGQAATTQQDPGARIPLSAIWQKAGEVERRSQAQNRTGRGYIGGFGLPNAGVSPFVASPVALNASTGRSIAVNEARQVDLGRAFRLMEMRCGQNRVKQDFNYQRFHERPGLKRKRLRSQRWQRRFKESFNAIVSRVENLRKKGW